jgi:hypothetical protein
LIVQHRCITRLGNGVDLGSMASSFAGLNRLIEPNSALADALDCQA